MPGMRDSVGVLVRGRDLVECASVSVGRARLGANCALHLVHVFLTRRVSGRQIEGAGSDNGSRRETHQGSVFHLSHARTHNQLGKLSDPTRKSCLAYVAGCSVLPPPLRRRLFRYPPPLPAVPFSPSVTGCSVLPPPLPAVPFSPLLYRLFRSPPSVTGCSVLPPPLPAVPFSPLHCRLFRSPPLRYRLFRSPPSVTGCSVLPPPLPAVPFSPLRYRLFRSPPYVTGCSVLPPTLPAVPFSPLRYRLFRSPPYVTGCSVLPPPGAGQDDPLPAHRPLV